MSKFYCKSVIIEESPAWEECKWHEALIASENAPVTIRFIAKNSSAFIPVTKSSILIREHEVCNRCKGKRTVWNYIDTRLTLQFCPHCLRDADGKPTGAEPGTAGKWKVKP